MTEKTEIITWTTNDLKKWRMVGIMTGMTEIPVIFKVIPIIISVSQAVVSQNLFQSIQLFF